MVEQKENKEPGVWSLYLFEIKSPVTGKSTGKGRYDDSITPRKKDKKLVFVTFPYLFVITVL